MEKSFCTAGAFSYPTGTASGYSPVAVTVTDVGVIPSSLTVRTHPGNRAGMNAAQSVQRYWTLTETGDLTTDLSFNYPDGDVVGDESSYQLYRWDGATATIIPGVLNTLANTISAAGVADFSDWAIGGAGSAPPADGDGDGVPDATDNCPAVANASQADADGDGIGDACDPTPHGDAHIVFASNRDGNFEIYEMRADGAGIVRLTNNAAADLDPALSPDRSKIAFTSLRDGNLEIYTMNADGTGLARLTSHGGDDSFPAWSPDGSKIAFTSHRDGNPEIYTMNADGSGPARLTNNAASDTSPHW